MSTSGSAATILGVPTFIREHFHITIEMLDPKNGGGVAFGILALWIEDKDNFIASLSGTFVKKIL